MFVLGNHLQYLGYQIIVQQRGQIQANILQLMKIDELGVIIKYCLGLSLGDIYTFALAVKRAVFINQVPPQLVNEV